MEIIRVVKICSYVGNKAFLLIKSNKWIQLKDNNFVLLYLLMQGPLINEAAVQKVTLLPFPDFIN